uniref:Uncharacterized protein n=1 Tax=Rhizophora mucronata TaxID=61149 RepID=A0A2P2NB37_RHIMU
MIPSHVKIWGWQIWSATKVWVNQYTSRFVPQLFLCLLS